MISKFLRFEDDKDFDGTNIQYMKHKNFVLISHEHYINIEQYVKQYKRWRNISKQSE